MAQSNNISIFVSSQVPDFWNRDAAELTNFIKLYYEWAEQFENPIVISRKLSEYKDVDLIPDKYFKFMRSEFMKNIPVTKVNDRLLMKNILDFYRARGTEKAYKMLFRILYGDENVSFYYPGKDILRASDGKWVIERSLKLNLTVPLDTIEDVVVVRGQVSNATARKDKFLSYIINEVKTDEFYINNVFGIFRQGEALLDDNTGEKIGSIDAVLTYPGGWIGTDGFLSSDKKLEDNYFYQEYSYQIRSSHALAEYETIANTLAHPAGTKLFGAVDMFAIANFSDLSLQLVSNLTGVGEVSKISISYEFLLDEHQHLGAFSDIDPRVWYVQPGTQQTVTGDLLSMWLNYAPFNSSFADIPFTQFSKNIIFRSDIPSFISMADWVAFKMIDAGHSANTYAFPQRVVNSTIIVLSREYEYGQANNLHYATYTIPSTHRNAVLSKIEASDSISSTATIRLKASATITESDDAMLSHVDPLGPPDWVPPDALAYLGFTSNNYFAVTQQPVTALLGGNPAHTAGLSFDASDVSSNGMFIYTEPYSTNRPFAIGDLFNVLKDNLQTGVTVIFDMYFINSPYGKLIEFFDNNTAYPDSDSYVELSINGGLDAVYIEDAKVLGDSVLPGTLSTGRHKIGAVFNRADQDKATIDFGNGVYQIGTNTYGFSDFFDLNGSGFTVSSNGLFIPRNTDTSIIVRGGLFDMLTSTTNAWTMTMDYYVSNTSSIVVPLYMYHDPIIDSHVFFVEHYPNGVSSPPANNTVNVDETDYIGRQTLYSTTDAFAGLHRITITRSQDSLETSLDGHPVQTVAVADTSTFDFNNIFIGGTDTGSSGSFIFKSISVTPNHFEWAFSVDGSDTAIKTTTYPQFANTRVIPIGHNGDDAWPLDNVYVKNITVYRAVTNDRLKVLTSIDYLDFATQEYLVDGRFIPVANTILGTQYTFDANTAISNTGLLVSETQLPNMVGSLLTDVISGVADGCTILLDVNYDAYPTQFYPGGGYPVFDMFNGSDSDSASDYLQSWLNYYGFQLYDDVSSGLSLELSLGWYFGKLAGIPQTGTQHLGFTLNRNVGGSNREYSIAVNGSSVISQIVTYSTPVPAGITNIELAHQGQYNWLPGKVVKMQILPPMSATNLLSATDTFEYPLLYSLNNDYNNSNNLATTSQVIAMPSDIPSGANPGHDMLMPHGIVPIGSMLLALVSYAGTPTVTIGSGTGWTLGTPVAVGAGLTAVYAWKIATGSDALTLNTSTSVRHTQYSMAIKNATKFEVVSATGINTDADPASITPSGGVGNYLWLVSRHATGTAFVNPANMDTDTTYQDGPITTQFAQARSRAASFNPSPFNGAANDWCCFTFAFYNGPAAFITEASDTVSSTAKLKLKANASITESNDTVSSASTMAVATDPYFTNVVLLAGFDGLNNATTYTEESPVARVATFVGDAKITTTSPMIGTGSTVFDGSGDRITFPDSPDWVFPSEFTIEFFASSPSWPVGTNYFMIQDTGAGNSSFNIQHNSTSIVTFQWYLDGSNVAYSLQTTTAGLTTNTPTHFAVDRDSNGKMRMYINGVMVASQTNATGPNFNSTTSLSLGGHSVGFGYFTGNLDEVRITKGVARYKTDTSFTVPGKFPRSHGGTAINGYSALIEGGDTVSSVATAISGAWTPLALGTPTLLAWQKADEITGSNTDPIATFLDGSGNGKHYTQVTSASRPTLLTANLNGKNVVKFDAPTADQYFDVPNIFSGKTAGSIYMVVKKTVDPARSGGSGFSDQYTGIHRFGNSTGASSAGHMPYTDGVIYAEFGTDTRKTAGDPTPSLASWRIISNHSAASDFGMYIDGGVYSAGVPAPFYSTVSNTVGFDPAPTFGRSVRDPTGSFLYKYMEGTVAEILLINGKLSLSDQQKVEGYLAYKWGLQANLDAAHPYKSSAPTGSSGALDGLPVPTSAVSVSRNLFASFSGTKYTTATGIDSLKDQTGNNFHFNQSFPQLQPTVGTMGANGRACAVFDGVDDKLPSSTSNLGNLISTTDGLMVAVVEIETISTDNSGAPWNNAVAFGDNNGYTGIGLRTTGPSAEMYNFNGSTWQKPSVTISTGDVHVLMWRHTGGNMYASIDGGTEQVIASGTTPSLVGATLILGQTGGTAPYANMKLAEFVSWNATMPTSTQLAAYIADCAAYYSAPDPFFSNVVLLAGFDGTNGATAATDEATGKALTFLGNAQLATATKKFGTAALTLDGTGDSVTTPDSADWDFTGNFTIECFAYSNNTGINGILIAQWTSFPNRAWQLRSDGNVPEFVMSNDGSASTTVLSSSTTISTGSFNHIAVDYDGTKYRLYLNGVMTASSTTHITINPSAAVLSIGADGGGSSFAYNGFIDEVRITKGVARYASDSGFTVPSVKFPRRTATNAYSAIVEANDTVSSSAVLKDPNFSNVVFLAGFDGTNGSTSISDESLSNHGAASITGNAQLSTAQKKQGTASLLLDGTNDYISWPDSNDWSLGTGQFTIEGNFYFAATTTNALLIAQWVTGGWAFWIDGGNLYFRDGSSVDSGKYAWSPSLSTWYHLAVDRDSSNVLRIYVDGVMRVKTTGYSQNIPDGNGVLKIGSLAPYFAGYDLNGNVDEVRITKGVARYASDAGFTAPTSAYPRQ
jgi:hypothetical protein